MNWIELKNFSSYELENARKQIHQAAQLPAIAGRCLNPEDRGDVYAALSWDKKQSRLTSHPLEASRFRAALSISTFDLVIINKKDESVIHFNLKSKTYDEAFSWLTENLRQLGFDSNRLNKKLPYQIPEYPTAKGEPFNHTNPAAFAELQKYYTNAVFILETISKKEKDVSQVRCWPHHFDIATLITIEKNSDPEKTKTIGVGLSPGDESYNEPYFYISPWPYPENKDNLPKPNYGHWYNQGWFGGVLTASEIIRQKDKSEQLKITENFIETGIANLRQII
jgi:hypothetical protein